MVSLTNRDRAGRPSASSGIKRVFGYLSAHGYFLKLIN